MAALLTVPDLIHFLGTLDWWQEDTSPNVEELKLSLIPKIINKNRWLKWVCENIQDVM
jgi:hypothetical protein